jgi:hypothetical protein
MALIQSNSITPLKGADLLSLTSTSTVLIRRYYHSFNRRFRVRCPKSYRRCGFKQQVAWAKLKAFVELLSTLEATSLITSRESMAALFVICLPIHSGFLHSLAGMSQEVLPQEIPCNAVAYARSQPRGGKAIRKSKDVVGGETKGASSPATRVVMHTPFPPVCK